MKEYSGRTLYASTSHHPRSWGSGGGSPLVSRPEGLAGLLERGSWDEYAAGVLRGLGDQAAALLLLDFDRFEAVNDAYGHQAGDMVLEAMAGMLTAEVRAIDLVGRFEGAGGHRFDRFLILLPAAGSQFGLTAAHRIRIRVRETAVGIRSPSGQQVMLTGLTASIGVAVHADAGEDLANLLRQADDALSRAKGEGRDRVALAEAAC
ncbi:diguanylate cyclase (GGDEF)-like protein [Amycolatopsis cihanbeyliensis]|uniref:Diguanylate cyclase (GGDEF)-like protein n=1 Tax=Amycolatopsis cihanbeyliensis TaxID=1128664 RepID=A0A542DK01_AMYCI|nr:diguanylate cyclase (GGDEF)-like protein [Amycolatopsis cihanbeyliensis]